MSAETLLVTGASSDLGIALLQHVATTDPAAPFLIAHANSGSDRLLALQQALGPDRLQIVRADFASSAAVSAFAESLDARPPTQVVHLPGLPLRYERFTKFDWAHFEKDLAIQVGAAVTILRRLLPKMVKQPRGRVVFTLSSVTRGVPPKFLSMYTVLKHAQLGLMKALAAEYAGTTVTVNGVSPSMIDTRFLQSIPEVAVQMAAASHPLKRNATPTDVVGAIAFLLSPAADYLTGVEVPIAGGSVF